MKKLILFAALLLFMSACSRQAIRVKGSVDHANGRRLYLSVLTPDGLFLLDSITIRSSNFDFKLKPRDLPKESVGEGPLFIQLSFSPENALTTLASMGQDVEIQADAESLIRTYKVQGPSDARAMWQLDSALAAFVIRTDTLMQIYQDYMYDDSVRSSVETRYNQIVDGHTRYLRDFITLHPHSLSAMIAFYQVYNNLKFLDEHADADLFFQMVDGLSETYPQSAYVKYLGKRRSAIENKNH